jgi:hypothetical protein
LADPSPFEYDDTGYFTAAERLPAGHPTRMVEALRNKLPEENKSLPKPRFFMDPRAMSLTNMIRGSMDTVGRWLEGKPKIGEDTMSPLGAAGIAAAGMTKPVKGGLSAFIGPGQAARLGRTPGSFGSLEALEAAQKIWAKGGTTPEGLAEAWSKHGWAPQKALDDAGELPFTWLQAPELRIKDQAFDDIRQKLAGGGAVKYTGQLQSILEPNADMFRLFAAEPSLQRATGTLRVGPKQEWSGYATPAGKFLSEPDSVPKRPMVMGQGPDPIKAESIMIGHELRGHAAPMLGNVQHGAVKGETWPALYRTKANEKLDGNPRLQDLAANRAGYLALPQEQMARHAHILDQLERQGKNPFAPSHAPGVMSTYIDRGMIDRQMINDMGGTTGLRLRDYMPGSGAGTKPLTADDLAPFMAQ